MSVHAATETIETFQGTLNTKKTKLNGTNVSTNVVYIVHTTILKLSDKKMRTNVWNTQRKDRNIEQIRLCASDVRVWHTLVE